MPTLFRLSLVALVIAGQSFPTWALEPLLDRLRAPELHCGNKPRLDIYEGVVQALAQSDASASELNLSRYEWELELVLHFEAGVADIPEGCLPQLEALNEKTKTGKYGPLLIRSSTQTRTASELDLAVASQRLDNIRSYLRENRLARKAMILELNPDASTPLLGQALDSPELVEIYSRPAK